MIASGTHFNILSNTPMKSHTSIGCSEMQLEVSPKNPKIRVTPRAKSFSWKRQVNDSRLSSPIQDEKNHDVADLQAMEGIKVESQNLTNSDVSNESLVPKTTHTNLDQTPRFDTVLYTSPNN